MLMVLLMLATTQSISVISGTIVCYTDVASLHIQSFPSNQRLGAVIISTFSMFATELILDGFPLDTVYH